MPLNKLCNSLNPEVLLCKLKTPISALGDFCNAYRYWLSKACWHELGLQKMQFYYHVLLCFSEIPVNKLLLPSDFWAETNSDGKFLPWMGIINTIPYSCDNEDSTQFILPGRIPLNTYRVSWGLDKYQGWSIQRIYTKLRAKNRHQQKLKIEKEDPKM
jgi:hypothetical protein